MIKEDVIKALHVNEVYVNIIGFSFSKTTNSLHLEAKMINQHVQLKPK